MKKLLKISFLLAVLCFAAPVFADEGDLPTGNKGCTQNCGTTGGLYEPTTIPTDSDEQKSSETTPGDSTIDEIYSWIYEQISEIIN